MARRKDPRVVKVFARRSGSTIVVDRVNIPGVRDQAARGRTHDQFTQRAVGEIVALAPSSEEAKIYFPNGRMRRVSLRAQVA